jgi:hypothetical protein
MAGQIYKIPRCIHNNNRQDTIDLNFKNRLDKVDNILQSWAVRSLSLKGKITVINTIAIPNMIYLSSVLHTPKWVVEKFQNLIIKFLWDNKPAKIKYNNLITATENGGLKLQDYQSKIDSLLTRWIRELNKDYLVPWKAYVSETLGIECKEIPFINMQKQDVPKFSEEFYNEVFGKWAQLHYEEPTNAHEIGRQIIWLNSQIKVDGKIIKYKRYHQAGIKHVKDLIDDNNQIGGKRFLENKFDITFKGLDYESLISAIPKHWKRELILVQKGDIIISPYVDIKIDNSKTKLIEIKTNQIYWKYIESKGERATSEKTWIEKTTLNLTEEEWQTVYLGPYKIPTDAKIISFHHKITHRIIACGSNLKKWKIKDSDKCSVCEEEDTIEHHFVECRETMKFWKHIYNWWQSITETTIPIHTYEILFLYPNENEDILTNQFNFVLSQGLYYIYRNKIGGKKIDPYELQVKIKQRLILESEISTKHSKEETFEKKWGTLMSII